jgi:hypothetical protein
MGSLSADQPSFDSYVQKLKLFATKIPMYIGSVLLLYLNKYIRLEEF